jgi:GMP synthase-like glutamine amidotransferase
MGKIKIAILDLYEGQGTETISILKGIIGSEITKKQLDYELQIFDVRQKNEIPDMSFNIYFSTGGPGSPFAGSKHKWESNYFNFLDDIYSFNQINEEKKYLFGICYSFQLMSRFFGFGNVTKRKFESFGAVKIQKTESGKYDEILSGLPNTFYAVDNRNWQVIEPNNVKLAAVNAKILAMEKSDKTLNQRAMMAIRIDREIFLTQFHPEKNSNYLTEKFKDPRRIESVINNIGKEKLDEMLSVIGDDKPIELTHRTIIPNFLSEALNRLS